MTEKSDTGYKITIGVMIMIFAVLIFVIVISVKPEVEKTADEWYMDIYKKCVTSAYRGFNPEEDMRACNNIKKLNDL